MEFYEHFAHFHPKTTPETQIIALILIQNCILHYFYGILYHVLTYYSLLSPIYKEIFYFKNVAHFNPKSTPTYILNQFYGQELIFFCSIAFAKKYFDKSHTFYSRLNKPYKVAHFHPKSSPKVTLYSVATPAAKRRGRPCAARVQCNPFSVRQKSAARCDWPVSRHVIASLHGRNLIKVVTWVPG